ncbi:MAG: sulfatase-like hydrolase/transferase, partial [Acidobacteriota bacterium]
LAGGLGSAGACSRPAAPPDVLLVTIDTLRMDHVSAYGGPQTAATPAFDRLAGSGVLFEQAIAPTPLTLPSHASILTGQWPFRHGVRDNGGFRLSESIPTLAEVLQNHGYRTAAFVASFVLDSRFGLDHGFELYDDDMGRPPPERIAYLEEVRRDGTTVARAASDWIEASGSEPIFVWAHLYDPHAPYDAEESFLVRYPGRPYAAAVAQADAALQTIIDAFERHRRSDRSIVVLTGDHGESLGEHKEQTHGVFLYDATLHVPLAVRAPGLKAGTRIPWQVRLVDLAPLIVGLTGVTHSPSRTGETAAALDPDGVDLSAALRGDAPIPMLPAYAESFFGTYHYGWSPLRALRERGVKWIEAPRPELYDLGRDPGETENRARSDPETAGRLSRSLMQLAGVEATVAPQIGPRDPETVSRLRSLGYVGSGAPPRDPDPGSIPDLPDPKDGIDRHARFESGFREAARHFDSGEFALALNRASSLLEEFPEGRDALRLRALAALNLERDRQARNDFEQLLEEDSRDVEALAGMGRILDRAGEREKALAHYLGALELGPERPDLHLRAGRLLRLQGELEAAAPHLRSALLLDPRQASATYELGLVALARGDLEEARERFVETAQMKADLRGVHHNLGLLLEGAGDLGGARREYGLEIGHHPGAYASHLNLALLLDRSGDRGAALEHFEAAAAAAPDDPKALTALAASLMRENPDRERVRSLLEGALRAAPDYAPAHDLLTRLDR